MDRNTMKSINRSVLLGIGLAVTLTFAIPAHAEDKCRGQKWPNLSEDCIDQIVAEVCKAGGGGKTCGKSEVKQLLASGTIKSTSSPTEIRRALNK